MSRIRYIMPRSIPLSRLKASREQQQVTAADLAKQIGISRQTIYAIEAGSFVPNTRIALQLARALQCSVEDLFSLQDEAKPVGVYAELLTNQPVSSNQKQLVRLVHSGNRQYALPLHDAFNFLPAVDGVTGRKRRSGTEILLSESYRNTKAAPLLIAGCDPALSFFAELASAYGIEIVPIAASSLQALQWLREGKVHAAGSHLFDQASREYNMPAIRRLFPKGGVRILTFSEWEAGLLTKPGNPKNIFGFADLASRDVSIVNREKGSGARAHFDAGLTAAGLSADDIRGYHRVVHGHLAAAFSVASNGADCCLANSSAARCFGLGFRALRTERFDLIFPDRILKTKLGQTVADLLNGSSLRRKLASVAGYETRHTGATVV